jgi:hypothetical protein
VKLFDFWIIMFPEIVWTVIYNSLKVCFFSLSLLKFIAGWRVCICLFIHVFVYLFIYLFMFTVLLGMEQTISHAKHVFFECA